MQHPANPASVRSPVVTTDSLPSRDAECVPERSAGSVPDAQLWRDAIGAARRAAAAAAEIRTALEQSRAR